MKKYSQYLLIITALVGVSPLAIHAKITNKGTFDVTRLNKGNPIITEAMFQALGATEYEGTSINGPSVIRIPDWIAKEDRANPEAKYYLYFAHHSDKYIRMAWAANIQGPWHLYDVGSKVKLGNRGVLDLGSTSMPIGNGIELAHNHIASPNPHVDHENKRIVMYFHSGSRTTVNGKRIKGQKTLVATSALGLEFAGKVEPVIIANSYLSVFAYNGELYGLDNGANSYKARDSKNPWQPPKGWDFSDELWIKSKKNGYRDNIKKLGFSSDQLRVRHTSSLVKGDTLYTFFSQRGVNAPERIMMSTTDLAAAKSYKDWDPTYPPEEIYWAQPGWEGGELKHIPSKSGRAAENLNELRDPYIFEDSDGELYVFYCGRGEDAIGVIHLKPQFDLSKPKNN